MLVDSRLKLEFTITSSLPLQDVLVSHEKRLIIKALKAKKQNQTLKAKKQNQTLKEKQEET